MPILHIPPKKERSYQMPTNVFYGRGLLNKIDQIISSIKSKKIVIVAGEHFKYSSDYRLLVQKLGNYFELTTYKPVIAASNFRSIDNLSNFCRTNNFDTVVAIGGGTILDVAKSAALLAKNTGSIKDFLQKNKPILKKGIKIVAVPTTAGTGSEVTPWATVWAEDKKYSFSSNYMFPEIALVDPQNTDSLTPKITAESGIDALCQAIESYWNKNHNPVSDQYALKSINLIYQNLKKAVKYGSKKHRDNMMLGSLWGGLSFSNTQTTICHALSYPITIHWKINHGQATSITLPLFIKIFFPLLTAARLDKILRALDSKTPLEASLKTELLMSKIGLKIKLSQLDINKKGVTLIIRETVDQSRLLNSPFIPSISQLKTLLMTIL